MSAIVISSSPPPLFAREPTPVSPSPPPSQGAWPGATSSPKRFKSSTATRDSFSNGFGSARALLVKSSAENLPLHTSTPSRFKTNSPSAKRRSPPFVVSRSQKGFTASERSPSRTEKDLPAGRLSGDEAARQNKREHTPEPTEKAIPRRTDWTPVADHPEPDQTPDSATNANLCGGLMDSFGFKTTKTASNGPSNALEQVSILKKQKIGLVEALPPIIQKVEKRKAKATVPKKPKAAVKKTKTITELVTSHHNGPKPTASPLASYLVATQAHDGEDLLSCSGVQIAVKAKKAGKKTASTSRSRSSLLSPTSAMKAICGQQQPVFGSLSQLAREEPTVELELSSDTVSPTRTQPISIESTTPRQDHGVARYRRSRNLWGAADRDENNALVFNDILDLTKSPAIGRALSEHGVHLRSDRTGKMGIGIGTGTGHGTLGQLAKSPSRAYHTAAVVDVDDVDSPSAGAASTVDARLAITNVVQCPVEASEGTAEQSDTRVAAMSVAAGTDLECHGTRNEPVPPKPRYAGMHTDDLKKAIQSYGFKPIKSREKMIEKLNQCWEAKEARRIANAAQVTAVRQSDFISNVHGLSVRPTPKTKKTKATKTTKPKKTDEEKTSAAPKKARKRKNSTPGKEADKDQEAAAQPKKRKRAATVSTVDHDKNDQATAEVKERKRASPKKAGIDDTPKPKKPRGRPRKVVIPAVEDVADVDDIDDEFTDLKMLRDEKVMKKTQIDASDGQGLVAISAPPEDSGTVPEALDEASLEAAIGQQIRTAILYQSVQAAKDRKRNHVKDPTWHEKMLLYDPIVVEDFARWLNGEGLAAIDEDREVSTVDVKTWCESNGICCLWKGGWRGQAAKKGSD